MIEENQDSSERLNDQPSTGSEASVAERIARALGPRPALADDVVSDEPSPEPFASVPERYEPAVYEPPVYEPVLAEPTVPEPVAAEPELSLPEPEPEPETAAAASEPAPGQFDVSFEGAIRLLNERLAEVVRREAALGSKEQGVQQALAEADDRWASLVEKENEVERSLSEAAATRSELDARAASVDQREAALALYEEELKAVSAHVDAQQAELERAQRGEHDSGSALAAREAALAQRENDAQAALDEAKRLLAEATDREQALSERERALSERGPLGARRRGGAVVVRLRSPGPSTDRSRQGGGEAGGRDRAEVSARAGTADPRKRPRGTREPGAVCGTGAAARAGAARRERSLSALAVRL